MAAEKPKKRHRYIRWLIQILFLGLFIYLFIQTTYSTAGRIQTLFFRFDPLIFIILSIAYRAVLTAGLLSIIMILGSFVFGRFFCGFICPLGTMIDICDLTIKKRISLHLRLKNTKFLLLIFLFISALLGGSFVHFFDPLVILERSFTLIIHPVATYLLGLFTMTANYQYTETFIVLAIFLIILGTGFIEPRFWCRNLCPLGALFGVISKFSVFKFSFPEKCRACNICERICPTNAIKSELKKIDSAECIDCLRCLYECPDNAIKYKVDFRTTPFDIKKRTLLVSLGAGIVAVPLTRSLLHKKLNGRLIRPPGSLPEKDFLNLCLHCGKCMKVCPTNGLQPCILEAGINGIWTPKLVPRIGGCEKNCNMCGSVCPTGAIRRLSSEEKTFVKIGTAVIDKNRCIAWEQDKVCLICDEACPYNAISSLNETIHNKTLLRPFVDERLCTGCGLCESRCPIEGPAAIRVFSIGEERKRSGTYITEEKIRLRACQEKKEDIPSGFITE
ncbi:MAG TPA: 4Fe-4S dicluster domain-containing protein [candidate division WOR-3 bacterium]|uniref:4Fe-4S dicluster domain-containing protein n=1 Tax=candidate division WOR-3 bacterium TaxID=2052148 RepID=A0A9C9EKC4_UNCW3|nr:4Fe-4S dicluster domain-containing protein [candidate division WOR-3 bacterium]